MIVLQDRDLTLHQGDALDVLPLLEPGSVDCVITSPPYWGLRDYSAEGQLGLEATPDLYVAGMVEVFRQVRRVLAPHGTCWINLGDSYNNNGYSSGGNLPSAMPTYVKGRGRGKTDTLKPKDLCMIPARVALALQADGWYLRSDIIWSKPNPMPESVTDRPTSAYEHVFLLAKQARYWFDAEAVREPQTSPDNRGNPGSRSGVSRDDYVGIRPDGPLTRERIPMRNREWNPAGRNMRNVWEIATQPYPEAHFATYPEELVRRCLLAGCPLEVCRTCGKPRERIVESEYERLATRSATAKNLQPNVRRVPGDRGGIGAQPFTANKHVTTLGWSDCGHGDYRAGVVLDPFAGSGTTLKVARDHGRHSIGVELSPAYCALIARRVQQLSLLAELLA